MTLKTLLESISPINSDIFHKAKERTSQLIMPPRAMGRINDIGEQLCAITGSLKPKIDNKAVFVMAADHGVATEGVSAFPQEVTGQMIGAFLGQMATINALCNTYQIDVFVTDVGSIHDLPDAALTQKAHFFQRKIAKGTQNFLIEPAMSTEQAEQAILTGFDIASDQIQKKGLNLVATGDMGIANTTASAAIGSVITGETPEIMTGRGTGIDDATLKIKTEVIKNAILKHQPNPSDGIDVLSKVGGFEIGAIAGVMLAAAYHKIPVVVDGIISTAGALIASTLCKEVTQYMIAGHQSIEPGHTKMLSHLNLTPILDLSMRLGEGTGAVIAMNVIDGAAAVIKDVATFEEAAVSGG